MTEDTITVTVSGKDTIDWIRSKVGRGDFASETELITEGVESLRQDDEEFETWLTEVVAKRYDANKADPHRAIPIEQVVKNLAERRRRRAESSL